MIMFRRIKMPLMKNILISIFMVEQLQLKRQEPLRPSTQPEAVANN